MAPRRRGRWLVADHLATPLPFEPERTVAAEVARVGPEGAVSVEVLRGEDVYRQRLDARRNGAVPRRADERRGLTARAGPRRIVGTHQPVLLRVALDLGRRPRLDVLRIDPHLPRNARRHRCAAAGAPEHVVASRLLHARACKSDG